MYCIFNMENNALPFFQFFFSFIENTGMSPIGNSSGGYGDSWGDT